MAPFPFLLASDRLAARPPRSIRLARRALLASASHLQRQPDVPLVPAPATETTPSAALPDVLIVEDSPEDYMAIRRTLRKLGLQATVSRFENGQAFVGHILDRLNGRRPLPSLVLLDLNMPGTDGRAVLLEIESNPRLAGRFPVVVCSTSASEDDVSFCEAHGATSYITKPVGLSGLESCLQHVHAYLAEGRPLPRRC